MKLKKYRIVKNTGEGQVLFFGCVLFFGLIFQGVSRAGRVFMGEIVLGADGYFSETVGNVDEEVVHDT